MATGAIIVIAARVCLGVRHPDALARRMDYARGRTSQASRDHRTQTYTKDVAPILFQHCASCHRPNDVAPFSVLSYSDVRPWARSIREKVVTREMPPWYPDQRYGEFTNDPRLTKNEIDIIANWVDHSAAEGDSMDLPPQPTYIDGWTIGKPDRILAMSKAYTVEPNASDLYVYAVIPTGFKEDKWIQAAEIRPGNKRVVHHAIAHVITPEALKKSEPGGDDNPKSENGASMFYKQGGLTRVRMDAPVIDDGANAANGGAAFKRRITEQGSDLFSMLLASYAPGKEPDVFPQGAAKRVPAGSAVVLQIHYSSFRGNIDKPERDQTSVALVFSKEPPEKEVLTLTVQNHFFKIPPGAANHQVTASSEFDQDVELINYMPHMHLRGKDMKYEVIYPDRTRRTLLWLPKFNFNWQTVYRLKNPVHVPKGSRMIVTAHFDNSAKNKYNPDASKAVRWGDPTSDEMMVAWMECVVPRSTKGDRAPASNSK
ncbi:MAG TPA: alkyl hydroperoxide reductase [Blastocatellia bacterium]|nr:alkyl hydroperoxide reductase [Blastocatellia bacterium]